MIDSRIRFLANRLARVFPNVLVTNEFEDICQQGWMIAMDCMKDYREDGGSSMLTWISQHVQLRLFELTRRRNLEWIRIVEGSTGIDPVCEQGQFTSPDYMEANAEATRALEIINSDGTRRIVEAHYLEGLTYPELGERMKRPWRQLRDIGSKGVAEIQEHYYMEAAA
jgi:DNA-directed RNA polymerase specialized sigma24 family protein